MSDEPVRVIVREKVIAKATVIGDVNPKVSVNLNAPPKATIGVVKQGPPGPEGPSGIGTATFIAGETLGVLSVVVSLGGKLYKADPTNSNHLGKVVGVTLQSVSLNDTCKVAIIGTIVDGTWTSGATYWVGLNGTLSVTPRAVGASWFQKIGIAHTTGIFVVDKGVPIIIGD